MKAQTAPAAMEILNYLRHLDKEGIPVEVNIDRLIADLTYSALDRLPERRLAPNGYELNHVEAFASSLDFDDEDEFEAQLSDLIDLVEAILASEHVDSGLSVIELHWYALELEKQIDGRVASYRQYDQLKSDAKTVAEQRMWEAELQRTILEVLDASERRVQFTRQIPRDKIYVE